MPCEEDPCELCGWRDDPPEAFCELFVESSARPLQWNATDYARSEPPRDEWITVCSGCVEALVWQPRHMHTVR